jgi:hypothetical protein
MTKISALHRRWSKDRDYKDAYGALGGEFDLARALIEGDPEFRELEPARRVAAAG